MPRARCWPSGWHSCPSVCEMSAPAKMRTPPGGFTLIEILVAMAIFGVVSLLAAQALSTMSKQTGLLAARQDTQREAVVLLRLLAADWVAVSDQTDGSLIAARRPAPWSALEQGQQLDLLGVRWAYRDKRLSRHVQGQLDPLVFGLEVDQLTFRWFQMGGLRDWSALDPRLPVQGLEVELVVAGSGAPLRQLIVLSTTGL